MTPTHSSTSTAALQTHRREIGISAPSGLAHERRGRHARRGRQPLGRYTDSHGLAREVIARQGSGGSVLVLDRDAATRGDRHLVAHLAADEPAENAAIVCSDYMRDDRLGLLRCRRVTDEDTRTAPFTGEPGTGLDTGSAGGYADPIDQLGYAYDLERVHSGMSIPELRWCRRQKHVDGRSEQVSLREVIARLESYEPMRMLTLRSLALTHDDASVSTTSLRAELARVLESPIVLNRGLREVVMASVERHELSMSEIATRCGRIKRDRKGNESGETSWLARRLGVLPEGGHDTPTPWIHSDVLALIARHGLGISPREVEL